MFVLCTCSYVLSFVPPVYKDYLCTRTTCVQGPPVYKDHLCTRTTCIQGPPVYKDHLCTRTTCIQGPPVYRGHLCTRTTCIQGPPVYKDHLYTRTTCIQGPPVHKYHLSMVTDVVCLVWQDAHLWDCIPVYSGHYFLFLVWSLWTGFHCMCCVYCLQVEFTKPFIADLRKK